MWIIEKIFSYLLFAVRWFWEHYEQYKEEGNIWKIFLLFLCSLSGLVLTVGSFTWLMVYLFTYHIEIPVIFGLIIWLYAYVKSVMEKKKTEEAAQKAEHQARIIDEESELEVQARKSRRLVCNVLYQTLREMAGDIGGVVPRVFSEIEITDTPYIIRNGVVFYQFRLVKESQFQYDFDDLAEFRKMLQAAISRKIQRGDFPTLGMDVYPYGDRVYDPVEVDTLEDVGDQFIIQAVLYTPAYAEYVNRKQNNQRMSGSDNASVPDATWEDKK